MLAPIASAVNIGDHRHDDPIQLSRQSGKCYVLFDYFEPAPGNPGRINAGAHADGKCRGYYR
jgi:hypothetical protein